MTTVFHVVGKSGVGRSELGHALAAQYQARGFRCEVCEMPSQLQRSQATAMWPDADFIFLEYHRAGDVAQTEPGDVVIRMERMAAAVEGAA